MTEKIGLDKGFGGLAALSGPRKAASAKPGQGKSSTDRVDFSAVLQEVSKTREARETVSAERLQRVAELKQQIADGSYKPDLDKVAASLVKFMGSEE